MTRSKKPRYTPIRSIIGLPGYVLYVRAKSKAYHFGLNGGRFWKGELPFEVSREKGKLGFSGASIVVRIIFLIWLIHFLWTRLV